MAHWRAKWVYYLKILLCVGFILCYVLLGSLAFALIEHSNIAYVEALWWAVVTFTTIGKYGGRYYDPLALRTKSSSRRMARLCSCACASPFLLGRLSTGRCAQTRSHRAE